MCVVQNFRKKGLSPDEKETRGRRNWIGGITEKRRIGCIEEEEEGE